MSSFGFGIFFIKMYFNVDLRAICTELFDNIT